MTTFRWPEILGGFLYVATFAISASARAALFRRRRSSCSGTALWREEEKAIARLTEAGANVVAASLVDAWSEIARLLGPTLIRDGGPGRRKPADGAIERDDEGKAAADRLAALS